MNAADEAAPLLTRRFVGLSPTVIEAVRFWERGRLAYNCVQLLLTAGMVAVRWPESRFLYTANLGSYLFYAVVANIFYSAAYIPEPILRLPRLRPFARPTRWVILITGTAFACFLAAAALDVDVFARPGSD